MTSKRTIENRLDDLEGATGVKGLSDEELHEAWREAIDPNKSVDIDGSDAYVELLDRAENEG